MGIEDSAGNDKPSQENDGGGPTDKVSWLDRYDAMHGTTLRQELKGGAVFLGVVGTAVLISKLAGCEERLPEDPGDGCRPGDSATAGMRQPGDAGPVTTLTPDLKGETDFGGQPVMPRAAEIPALLRCEEYLRQGPEPLHVIPAEHK